jgi:hypothetical protein
MKIDHIRKEFYLINLFEKKEEKKKFWPNDGMA